MLHAYGKDFVVGKNPVPDAIESNYSEWHSILQQESVAQSQGVHKACKSLCAIVPSHEGGHIISA